MISAWKIHAASGGQRPKHQGFSTPMNVVQVWRLMVLEPFTDWRVRRALALAVNREEIIEGAAWGHRIPLQRHQPGHGCLLSQQSGRSNHDPELANSSAGGGTGNLRFTGFTGDYAIHADRSLPPNSGGSWGGWICRLWSGGPGWAGYKAITTHHHSGRPVDPHAV